ncbi:MAG TPA: PRC-barrel domain-containing protein [Gammaproteobacteria bacterium]
MRIDLSRSGLLLLALLASSWTVSAESGPAASDEYWRVSNLLESTAVSAAGEPLGDVEDIVFGAEGEIYSVLVNRDLTTIANDFAEPVEEGARRSMYEEMLSADFKGANFSPHEARLQLADGARVVYGRDDRQPSPVGRFRASRIIGLPVNLVDDDGFGKIVDILIRPDSRRAYGFVVETGIFGGEYLLPPEFAALDRETLEMNFSVSTEEIEQQ